MIGPETCSWRSTTADSFGPAAAVLSGAEPLCYTITWEGPRFPDVSASLIITGSLNNDSQEISWTSELRIEHPYSGLNDIPPGVNNAYSLLLTRLSQLQSQRYPSAWPKILLSGFTNNSDQVATACVAELLRSGPVAYPMTVHVLEPEHLRSGRVILPLWGDRVMPLGPNGPHPLQNNSASQSTA